MPKKVLGVGERAGRMAAATIAFVLVGAISAIAYADGHYKATMSFSESQSPQCAGMPRDVAFDVVGDTVKVVGQDCSGPLKADRTFSCSFHARANSTTTFSGKISGPTIDGSFDLAVTPPPVAGPGFSCHGAIKGSAS